MYDLKSFRISDWWSRFFISTTDGQSALSRTRLEQVRISRFSFRDLSKSIEKLRCSLFVKRCWLLVVEEAIVCSVFSLTYVRCTLSSALSIAASNPRIRSHRQKRFRSPSHRNRSQGGIGATSSPSEIKLITSLFGMELKSPHIKQAVFSGLG